MAIFIDVAVVQEPNQPPLNLSDVRAQLSTQGYAKFFTERAACY